MNLKDIVQFFPAFFFCFFFGIFIIDISNQPTNQPTNRLIQITIPFKLNQGKAKQKQNIVAGCHHVHIAAFKNQIEKYAVISLSGLNEVALNWTE